MKIQGHVCEYISEFAKNLIWQENYFALDNQVYVSNKQYLLFKGLVNKVEFIVTDGSLLHGLYYNLHNTQNMCDKEKTAKFILEKYNEFQNINIFLERGDFKYEQAGRQQTESEARDIDLKMKQVFDNYNISYECVKIQGKDVSPILEIIKRHTQTISS